jgi:large subunit ribosomal protein L15
MRLEDLKPAKGSTKKDKRIGRGQGSGHGQTSTKGHKGQKARSGGHVGPGFEGGQMPLQRRVPKRGFNNANFANNYSIVNLRDLDRIEGQSEITPEVLLKLGLVKKASDKIKILGKGEIKRALTVRANAFSKGTPEKIAAAGGRAEVI